MKIGRRTRTLSAITITVAIGLGLVALADGANRTLRTGLRWNASPSATLGLEATREESGAESAPANAIMLRAAIRF